MRGLRSKRNETEQARRGKAAVSISIISNAERSGDKSIGKLNPWGERAIVPDRLSAADRVWTEGVRNVFGRHVS